jgi:hypothetical protein
MKPSHDNDELNSLNLGLRCGVVLSSNSSSSGLHTRWAVCVSESRSWAANNAKVYWMQTLAVLAAEGYRYFAT